MSAEKRPPNFAADQEDSFLPEERSIDASPGEAQEAPKSAPQSIRDTKVWQESTSGLRRVWSNYVELLSNSFKRMPRAEQESFIQRICVIVTIGVAIILIIFFYSFMPVLVRTIAVPIIVLLAYVASVRVVTPVMLARYDQYLNREY